MEVTRESLLTGIVRTRDLDITMEQVVNYRSGMLIQLAFPNLSTADKEFLQTGITEDEWETTIPDE